MFNGMEVGLLKYLSKLRDTMPNNPIVTKHSIG